MPNQLTCTRRLEWDAGHRVLGHEGKCANLHGHRYAAEITCMARMGTDSIGRVIDFSVIKERVGGWIDENWDHNILLHPKDPLARAYLYPEVVLSHRGDGLRIGAIFGDKEPFIFHVNGQDYNPTAENIARHLFNTSNNLLLPSAIEVVHIRVYETPNSYADYGTSFQKEV